MDGRGLHDEAGNLAALMAELDWLDAVVAQSIASYLKHAGHERHWESIPMPRHDPGTSIYGRQIEHWRLDRFERLALVLAMAPHLRPESLDVLFGINAATQRGFTEFGGQTDGSFSGFLPTGQTLMFLIAGSRPQWRASVFHILSSQHRFGAEQVFQYASVQDCVPGLAKVLMLSDQWLHYFINGEKVRPELERGFPAMPIATPLAWHDLVLGHAVMSQVAEIRAWLTHGHALMHGWGLANKVTPGYRAVFYGPPGTGKTLTAALLGKVTDREVYRVDLSMVVSKYIGETEKNLGRVFDVASYKDWILFFDEADALFGKRTQAVSANDRHANQQTGYLLQRIEEFPGTVILATNLRANMDEAFTRRFQSMVHFTIPEAPQRLALWRNAFDGVCELAPDVSLERLAEEHELAGGAIVNVLRYCTLTAISQGRRHVCRDDILTGIRREFRKDGRSVKMD